MSDLLAAVVLCPATLAVIAFVAMHRSRQINLKSLFHAQASTLGGKHDHA